MLFTCNAIAQHTGTTFTLSQPISSSGDISYTANNYILLKPGFSMQANNVKNFTATIGGVITPPTGQTIGGADENNDGGVVGEIPLHFYVNETGAAICNVPFDLPPGLNGLTPELGFNYNSQRMGEGIMGDGWGIQGISSISKVPWNYYYNEGSSSIQFSFEDQLMLDGQYLIKSGNEYRTEKESFDKIVLFNTANQNGGFKVFKPNGLVYYYGTDDESRLRLQNNNNPIAWYLKKIEDVNGNTIEYSYETFFDFGAVKVDGYIIPTFVKYGGNPNQNIPHKYRVQFSYRPHYGGANGNVLGWKKYYTSDATNKINYTHDVWELDSVRLQYAENGSFSLHGTKIWKYMLVYPLNNDAYTDKRQLEKILFTQFDKKYNPLKFEWRGNENDHQLQQSAKITAIAQFDVPSTEEQYTQLMTFRHKVPYQSSAHLDHLMCYYRQNIDSHVFQWYYNNSSPSAHGNMNGFSLDNPNTKFHTVTGIIKGFKIWDIDNDGNDEIVYLKLDNSGYYSIRKVKLETTPPSDELIITFSSFNADWFMFGDFDGNGYLDLMYRKDDGYMGWMMSDGDGLFDKVFSSSPNMNIGNIQKYYTGHFSGAQKDELIFCVNEQGSLKTYYVGLKPTTSGNVIPEKVEITGGASTLLKNTIPNKSCFTGDFNNDGKTDFLFIDADIVVIYLSAGKGIFVKEDVENQPFIGLQEGENVVRCVIADVNGDGYDDLIVMCRNEVQDHIDYQQHYYRYDCLLSPLAGKFRFINQMGDYQVEIKPYDDDVIYKPLFEYRLHILQGNFIGTSSNHLLFVNFNAYNHKIHSRLTGAYNSATKEYPKGHLIKKITNGMGDVTTIEYAAISDRASIESPVGELPFAYYRGNECVVTKYKGIHNLSKSFTYDSRYYFHKLGKGFLGFKSMTETDDRTGTVTTKTFNLNTTYYFMYPYSTVVKQKDNDKKISETIYTFTIRPIGGTNEKRYYPCLDKEEIKEYDDKGVLKKTTTTGYSNYDTFYNPKTITFTVKDDDNRSFSKTSYITYKNINTQAKYLIGLKETLREYFAAGIDVRTEFTYYDKGMLKTKKTFFDKPNPITETYSYDVVGNLTSIVQSAVGSPNRTTSLLYTDDKRFRKSSTNALKQTEHFQYNPLTGLMTQSSNYNGLITRYYYDAMGRLEKTILPDGRFSVTARFWKGEEENAPENTLYYIWSQTSGESPIWNYYDRYGRELRNLYQSANTNSHVAVDKEYGTGNNYEFDLVKKESLPYIISSGGGGGNETKGNPTIYWKNYIYNRLQQPTKITYPDQSQQTYVYDKNTISFTGKDGIVYEKTYHGNGLIRELKSNGTTVEFLYTRDCLPAGTKHNENAQLTESITYDDYRRPNQKKEMNRGTTILRYNGWGELREKEEPAGITSYQYDALGRMTKKTAPDHIITWKYDDGYMAAGLITQETFKATDDNHQTTKEYEYDYRAQLKKETQIISGEDPWTFEYAYDAIGQLRKTRYPSGFEVRPTWKYGWLTEMKDKDNNSLWRAGTINAFGQYEKEYLGKASKNINISYDYDDYNARLKEVKLQSSNITRVRQSYHWFPNGNMNYRKNEILGNVEKFGYDNFNRLTTVTLNGMETFSTTYDLLGNPTEYGTIRYDDINMPYAATYMMFTPYAYQYMNQTASYNTFNKIKEMQETESLAWQGPPCYAWQAWYGPSEELVKQKFTSSSGQNRLRRIFGNYQTETGTTEKNYVYLPNGSLVGWTSGNNFYYTLRDHLGSIIAVVNQDGNMLQQLSYDAWGQRRNPNTWDCCDNLPTPLTTKGFTAHEHLDNFKLINMGGRMYDPVIGRFLNPDIIVQFPENSQSYNRYSYCLNNPLKFTDPSGWALWDDEWEINNKGEINRLNDFKHYMEKDGQLVEVDKLINRRKRSIYVTQGILGQPQADNYQSYGFSNAVEAENFYYFVAESSNVEWAFAKTQYHQGGDVTGFVGTDFGTESTKMIGLYEKTYGTFVKFMSHSHWVGSPPSCDIIVRQPDGSWGKGGDINSARNSEHNYKREVYDVPNRTIYEYDKYNTKETPFNYRRRKY